MSNKIPSYVLNDFLRFERKLYSIFGMNLGRSIQFKTLVYLITTLFIFLVLSLLPLIGPIVRNIPIVLMVAIAIGVAYLLTDVGTENRAPIRFFASFIRYHWIALRHETYYKGKVLPKPKTVKFQRIATVNKPPVVNEPAEPDAPPLSFGQITVREPERSELDEYTY